MPKGYGWLRSCGKYGYNKVYNKVILNGLRGCLGVRLKLKTSRWLICREVCYLSLVKEGDVIDISLDDEETEGRSERIKKLADEVWG